MSSDIKEIQRLLWSYCIRSKTGWCIRGNDGENKLTLEDTMTNEKEKWRSIWRKDSTNTALRIIY